MRSLGLPFLLSLEDSFSCYCLTMNDKPSKGIKSCAALRSQCPSDTGIVQCLSFNNLPSSSLSLKISNTKIAQTIDTINAGAMESDDVKGDLQSSCNNHKGRCCFCAHSKYSKSLCNQQIIRPQKLEMTLHKSQLCETGFVFSKVLEKVRVLSKPERIHGYKCIRSPRGRPVAPVLNYSKAKILIKKSIFSSMKGARAVFGKRCQPMVNSNVDEHNLCGSKLRTDNMCFLTIGRDLYLDESCILVAIGLLINPEVTVQKRRLVCLINERFALTNRTVTTTVVTPEYCRRHLIRRYGYNILKIRCNHELVVVSVNQEAHPRFISFICSIL